MRRIRYSISILFLEMVFGESDGSVKLESYFTAHLSGASRRFLQRDPVVFVNLATSQFGSSGIVFGLLVFGFLDFSAIKGRSVDSSWVPTLMSPGVMSFGSTTVCSSRTLQMSREVHQKGLPSSKN